VNRRSALVLLAAAPCVFAQRARVPRIGVLFYGTPATEPNLRALLAALRELGYVEGRTAEIEYHYAEGRPERLRDKAVETVAGSPDVIVALGGDVVPFARAATSTVPIVMLTSNDPVEAGIVASFARPGGNVTGVAFVSAETGAKRLQFLKEAMPSASRVAVLWNPDHPDGEFRDIEAAARQIGVSVQSLQVRRPEDFDAALQAAARGRADALMLVSSRLVNLNRDQIVEFANRQRIPVVCGWGPWAQAGGLLSYGPDLDVLVRRAAAQVDRILKGAKPADIPVEQPDKFELIINEKAAKLLGVTIPATVLRRADQVVPP
jgi:putative ABC transport system substrate-binding protein